MPSTFNRTIVELKLTGETREDLGWKPFNRTIVELKLRWRWSGSMALVRLLIEPLWNWNLRRTIVPDGKEKPFNRTIVELKLGSYRQYESNYCRLLIEPLWNWNTIYMSSYWSRGRLLIEPLWNWNGITDILMTILSMTFNRTIVELKLFWGACCCQPYTTFNRTIVELKRTLTHW